MDTKAETRKETRKRLESITLPFLGSREKDHQCFEYLIVDVSKSGMSIAIPRWVISREKMNTGDIINLHLPFKLEDNFYEKGMVMWTRWDDVIEAEVCGIKSCSADMCQYLNPDMPETELALRSIKDSVLAKKGVLIYLNHLIPYFSKTTQYIDKDYTSLSDIFLEDIARQVDEHAKRLEQVYEKLKKEMDSIKDLPRLIDLEELRTLIESEIYIEIFKITFSDEHIMPYLNAIKKLENNIYSNYNTIVMVYLKTL